MSSLLCLRLWLRLAAVDAPPRHFIHECRVVPHQPADDCKTINPEQLPYIPCSPREAAALTARVLGTFTVLAWADTLGTALKSHFFKPSNVR